MSRQRLRQCYLGHSSQGTLCLIPPPPLPLPEPLGECYINKLPDELLAEILAYLPRLSRVTCPYEPDEPPTYEQCPPISLVCKRWQRHYDTIQYRINLFSDYPTWQRLCTRKVLKTLRQQAELRHHVREITIYMDYMSESTYREIVNTIKFCRAIHTVVLRVKWSAQVWPIIHAIKMLPRLQYLALLGPCGGLSLPMLLGHFNQPTLRFVRLHGYCLASTWISFIQPEPPSQEKMDMLSVVARPRSSAVTSLDLIDPRTSPLCTMILLQWVSKLVRLSLSALTYSTYGSHYTHEAVELILNVHRESLQHITVGMIPRGRNEHGNWNAAGIPDFSRFPCLRELQLSYHNIFFEKPSQAAAKLAAPVMCHLAISFRSEDERPDSEDQPVERRRKFAEAEVLWMVEFVSQGPIREPNTRSKIILVDYDPWLERASHHTTTPPWPWEYLQQAEKELSRNNVAMTYSKPRWTKEEWDQVLRDHRENSGVPEGLTTQSRRISKRWKSVTMRVKPDTSLL